MEQSIEQIHVDDLTLEVRRSATRRTLGLTVDRGGELILHLPEGCGLDAGRAFVEEKRFWLYRKLAEKHRLFQPPQPKQYVSGEGHYYLGRSYRIKLVDPGSADDAGEALRFRQGRFLLRRDAREQAPAYFTAWYVARGQDWLTRRIRELSPRMGAAPAALRVQELGYRWGSCTPEGRILFHWRTMQLPPRIATYVVAHELVHLLMPHHGPEFWQRLERAMPDYAERRAWLAENGMRFS